MSQGENKPKVHKSNTKKMLVRYGQMKTLGWFEHHEAHIPKTSQYVVIKSERGLELGEVVGEHSCYKGGQFKSSEKQVEDYYCNRTRDYPIGEGGQFVRFATTEDVHEQEHLKKNAIGEAKCCQKVAAELNLDMKIIEAEHLFGGERIIFYFTSEGRVDFRELVKRLAREYQTRIELRQIGSRDEARLISDYESCGQQCCCSRYLKILEPVNMRMAKLQKATLDPSKISGHCGRLKCCLRYEDETYMELKKSLPKRGAIVFTPKGQGKVIDVQILTQLVVVQTEMGDRQAWSIDEIATNADELKVKMKALEEKAAAEMQERMGEDYMSMEVEEKGEPKRNGEQSGRKKDGGEGDNAKNGGDEKPSNEQKRPRRENRRGGNRNRRRKPKTEGGGGNRGDGKKNNVGQNNSGGNQNAGGENKSAGGDKKDGQDKGDGQQKKRPNNRRGRNRRNNNRNRSNNNSDNKNQSGGGENKPNQPKPAGPKPSGPSGE